MTPSSPPDERARSGSLVLAMVLAAVTGYVDGLGVTVVSGVFVSFMSGNTTSTAVAIGHLDGAAFLHVALAIPLYLIGVVAGSALLRRNPGDRHLVVAAASLVLTAFFLWRLVGPAESASDDGPVELVTLLLLTVPMGLVTTTLRHVGPDAVGIGYITGTLVSLGEALSSLLFARTSPPDWSAIRLYSGLWLTFLVGAIAGAVAAGSVRAFSVLPAVVALVAVSIAMRGGRARKGRPRPR